ncbi:MAG: hypothetical protein M3O82_02360 [Verrucomicrobiota bacterium]|nr:hypothetical protein [Verrucomicrobiota bacterium]
MTKAEKRLFRGPLSLINMKSIRFSKVVEASGEPEPYTLWQDPTKDKSFQTALRENRVMTLVQSPTGKKSDSGEVGYNKEEKGELLIFPRSLKKFEGNRIVGIKYNLLEEAKDKRPTKQDRIKPRKKLSAAPSKVIEFPKVVEQLEEAEPDEEESARELVLIKQQIRKALEALSKDRPVAAYKILSVVIER